MALEEARTVHLSVALTRDIADKAPAWVKKVLEESPGDLASTGDKRLGKLTDSLLPDGPCSLAILGDDHACRLVWLFEVLQEQLLDVIEVTTARLQKLCKLDFTLQVCPLEEGYKLQFAPRSEFHERWKLDAGEEEQLQVHLRVPRELAKHTSPPLRKIFKRKGAALDMDAMMKMMADPVFSSALDDFGLRIGGQFSEAFGIDGWDMDIPESDSGEKSITAINWNWSIPHHLHPVFLLSLCQYCQQTFCAEFDICFPFHGVRHSCGVHLKQASAEGADSIAASSKGLLSAAGCKPQKIFSLQHIGAEHATTSTGKKSAGENANRQKRGSKSGGKAVSKAKNNKRQK